MGNVKVTDSILVPSEPVVVTDLSVQHWQHLCASCQMDGSGSPVNSIHYAFCRGSCLVLMYQRLLARPCVHPVKTKGE